MDAENLAIIFAPNLFKKSIRWGKLKERYFQMRKAGN